MQYVKSSLGGKYQNGSCGKILNKEVVRINRSYIQDISGEIQIKGDMLLTSNGENIYPEDAETAMNASTYIKESILTQRGEKLHAIVVPDREKALADGLDDKALEKKIDEAVREAGKKLPGFAIINTFELRDEPLERTPKGSIKRFLYS